MSFEETKVHQLKSNLKRLGAEHSFFLVGMAVLSPEEWLLKVIKEARGGGWDEFIAAMDEFQKQRRAVQEMEERARAIVEYYKI